MEDAKKCKITECCKTHWYKILGVILLVLAVILTVITFSGLGILGMFLAGLMLCCHKHLSSKMGWGCCDGGCGCDCSCCSAADVVVYDTHAHEHDHDHDHCSVEKKPVPPKPII